MNDDVIDAGIVPAKQIVLGKDKEITEANFLGAVDEVIQNLYKEGDMIVVDDVTHTLLTMQHFTGRALAKLWWGAKQWWMETKQAEKSGDTFRDHMEERHGIQPIRLDRYVLVWEYTQNNKLPKRIVQRAMKDQIAIAQMLEQGFEPDKDQWKKLERAANNSDVLEIIREIKKQKPKKGSLQIYLEKDGSLQAWYKNKKCFVGYLNVDEDEEEVKAIVDRAIERIVSIGIIRR